MLDAAADAAVERVLDRMAELSAQPQPEVLDTDDAAALFGLCRQSFLALKVPFVQCGSLRRYRRETLLQWLAEREQKP